MNKQYFLFITFILSSISFSRAQTKDRVQIMPQKTMMVPFKNNRNYFPIVSPNTKGVYSSIISRINYLHDNGVLKLASMTVYIDDSIITLSNQKPCPLQLLRVLHQDYKRVIVDAMRARRDGFLKSLEAYKKDESKLGKEHEESDLVQDWIKKVWTPIYDAELSKNPVMKEFFATFTDVIEQLSGAEEFSQKMLSIPLEKRTLADNMESLNFQMAHEDVHHHYQQAYEAYIATFIGTKIDDSK